MLIHYWGSWVARFAIASWVVFVTFAYLRYRPELSLISATAVREPVGWGLLGVHFASIGLLSLASRGVFPAGQLPARDSNLAAAVWIAAAMAAIASAGFAFLPWKLWRDIVRATVTCASTNLFRSMWISASHITSRLVQFRPDSAPTRFGVP